MRKCFRLLGLSLLVVSLGRSLATGQDVTGYVGAFVDGTKLRGQELKDLSEAPAAWNLDGKFLFDSDKPLRWLKNRKLPAASPPASFIEFRNGDLLPGEVSHFHDAKTPEEDFSETCLVMSTTIIPAEVAEVSAKAKGGVFRPGVRFRTLRINVEQARRVVWQRRTNNVFTPKTIYFRDGKIVPFRSLRWEHDGVKVLTEEGTKVVPFAEIAELHLEAGDIWAEYTRQLAVLMPELFGRLLQIETEEGGRITVAAERFQMPALYPAGVKKGEARFRYVLQPLQPTWSLDVVWIDLAKIRTRRYFFPYEIPLSSIAPSANLQSTGLARSWRPQTDHNVQGGPLSVAGVEYGWGFGVQAFNQLEFDLPPFAKSFRTAVALDQVAGTHGCAKGVVVLYDTQHQPFFQSAVFVGSKEISDSGKVDLPDIGQPKRKLILLADPLLKGAPAGSDPLEIGDALDWLEPMIYLDPKQLSEEVARQVDQIKANRPVEEDRSAPLRQTLAKIAPGFELSPPELQKPDVTVPGVEVRLMPAAPFFSQTLRRITSIPAGKISKLRIQGTSGTNGSVVKMAILANGKQVALLVFDMPHGNWEAREADLTPFAGRRVAIEINNVDPHPYFGGAHIRSIEIVSSDPPPPLEKKPAEEAVKEPRTK